MSDTNYTAWGHEELVNRIAELEEALEEIKLRCKNPGVHLNVVTQIADKALAEGGP